MRLFLFIARTHETRNEITPAPINRYPTTTFGSGNVCFPPRQVPYISDPPQIQGFPWLHASTSIMSEKEVVISDNRAVKVSNSITDKNFAMLRPWAQDSVAIIFEHQEFPV